MVRVTLPSKFSVRGGKDMDLVVNEIDEYQGSNAIRVQKNAIIGLSPGVHVVVVTADGEWKVDIGD